MPAVPWNQLNYVAIAVAAVAAFFLGALWYTALFGKLWQRLNGYSDEKLHAMQQARPPHIFFTTLLGCYLLVAFVVALVLAWAGVASAAGGAAVGLALWLGPNAAIKMTDHVASDKPLAAFGVDSSFQLIYLVMMGAILGGWR